MATFISFYNATSSSDSDYNRDSGSRDALLNMDRFSLDSLYKWSCPNCPNGLECPDPCCNNARDRRVSNTDCPGAVRQLRNFLHLLLSITFRSPTINLARSFRHTDLGTYLGYLTRRVRYRRFYLLRDSKFLFYQRWRLSTA